MKPFIKKIKRKILYSELIKKCKDIIDCDCARISEVGNKLFLVIGTNRNTSDDDGVCVFNDEVRDFDYVQETVIASGETEEQLLESVKEYNELSKMNAMEYLFGKK